MQLSRTPSLSRVHDYNLALTKDELLGLFVDEKYGEWEKVMKLIQKEVDRLGSGE